MIDINDTFRLTDEIELENLWGVWVVHKHIHFYDVALYKIHNKQNYYIPFVHNNLPVILRKD